MSLEMRIPATGGEADLTEVRQSLRQTTSGAARQVIVRRLDDVDGGGYQVGVGQGRLHLSSEAAEALLVALAKLLIEPRSGQARR